MDVVALVEFALEVGDADHDEEVLPDVGGAQFEGLADGAGGANLGARDLAILGEQDTLAFERVEVLGEGAAEGAEVVPLDDQREQRVELIEGVEDPQEIPWMTVCRDGEDISN
jgi:hypothetical protein